MRLTNRASAEPKIFGHWSVEHDLATGPVKSNLWPVIVDLRPYMFPKTQTQNESVGFIVLQLAMGVGWNTMFDSTRLACRLTLFCFLATCTTYS